VALIRLLTGGWISAAIHVAACLGLADEMAEDPVDTIALAERVGADPDALYRLLRMLASVGVFAEHPDRRFGLSPMAACLRKDHPASLQPVAELAGGLQHAAWGDLKTTITSGTPAFEGQHGMSLWSYLDEHPAAAALFDAAMAGGTARTHAAVVEALDFDAFASLVDAGGGNGALAVKIARASHRVELTVYDRPGLADRARETIAQAGMDHRIRFRGGDFFTNVPPGADAYLLCAVLHDWDDERAHTILTRCRAAMPNHARLMIVESILPTQPGFHLSKLLDMNMLVMHGGRERTVGEFEALLTGAGFALESRQPTTTSAEILFAGPV
jgi:hypothetical protein